MMRVILVGRMRKRQLIRMRREQESLKNLKRRKRVLMVSQQWLRGRRLSRRTRMIRKWLLKKKKKLMRGLKRLNRRGFLKVMLRTLGRKLLKVMPKTTKLMVLKLKNHNQNRIIIITT